MVLRVYYKRSFNLLTDEILTAIKGKFRDIFGFKLKQIGDCSTLCRDGQTGEKKNLNKRESEFYFGHLMFEILIRHHME